MMILLCSECGTNLGRMKIRIRGALPTRLDARIECIMCLEIKKEQEVEISEQKKIISKIANQVLNGTIIEDDVH